MTDIKRCSRCGETKPLGQFSNNRKFRDGHQYWCRDCFKSYDSEGWRDPKHPAHISKMSNAKKWHAIGATYGTDRYWVMRETIWKRSGILNDNGTPFLRQDYLNLWELQNGLCELCGTSLENRGVNVDHEHRDGKYGPVRALVCWFCNINRIATHDLESAKKLVTYLESHPVSRLSQPRVK